MPPMVIAAGMMGGTTLASGLMNRNSGKKQADQALGLQQQQAQRQSALANTISGFAKNQHTMAEPAMNKAMQYYMQLAGGNRAVQQQALSPQIGMLNANYSGAERGMMARMAPGAQRDSAIGDLYRDRANSIGQLGIQGRREGVEGLANMGQNLMGGALGAYGAAGNTLSGAAGTYGNVANAYQNRANNSSANWASIGASMGQALIPYLMGGSGGPSPLPSSRINIPGMYGSY